MLHESSFNKYKRLITIYEGMSSSRNGSNGALDSFLDEKK